MGKATPMWQCSGCNELHEDEDDAENCCRPEVYEVWRCDSCGKRHDEELEAENCCAEHDLTRCPRCARDYSAGEINAAAVRIAGHCNTCNPFFSVDQQIHIENLHLERNPWSDQRLL